MPRHISKAGASDRSDCPSSQSVAPSGQVLYRICN